MATTFYFNETTSAAPIDITSVATTGTKIIITNITRPVRKPVTRHKLEIPGRKGSWDFGGGVVRDFRITVNMAITANASSNLIPCAEAVSSALDGKHTLYFSDSTALTYEAQTYSEISFLTEGNGDVGRATIVFECDAT